MRSSAVVFLTVDEVLALHELALEVGGGAGTATRDDLAAAFARAMGDRVALER